MSNVINDFVKENNIKLPQIFIDMDEVLYDLSDFIRLHVNETFNTNYPYGFNKSYWWKDYGIPKSYFELLLKQQGTFLEGEPIKDSVQYVKELYNIGFDIHILTRPQQNQHCYYEKNKFVKKYFPYIDIDTHFHTSGNKGLFANPNRILIDDDINHLNNWVNNNGIAICFGNYGWNKKWQGLKCNTWENLYEMLVNVCIYNIENERKMLI